MILFLISITKEVSKKFVLFVETGYQGEDTIATPVESAFLSTIITAHGSITV
jgi:hypothetical protein